MADRLTDSGDHVVLHAGDSEFLAAEFYGVWLVMLLASLLLSYAVQRWHCQYVSEASITLLVGFVGGGILQLSTVADASDALGEAEVRDEVVGFSSTFVFCVLLPPIIFISGYRMRGNFFWANIEKILTLAFAGTLISSVVVGALIYAMRDAVSLEKLSLAEAMAFGALISSTDPVTTLAIFEQLNVDPNLFNIIFGESVLNDAVSIVLFHTFTKLITYEGSTLLVVWYALADFTRIFVGSTLVGLVMGCAAALLFKHLPLRRHSREHGPQLELAIFMTYCYGPFLLAECFSLSGIVAILFTGFAMKHYAYRNLSEQARGLVEAVVALLAQVSEAVVFLDVGTSAWRSFQATPSFVFWAAIACVTARAANVYPLAFILNSRRIEYPQRKFERAHMHMVCFSGLRGAIAYALSNDFPGTHRREIASATMALVLLSVWGLGGATVPVVRRLGIRCLQLDELKQLSLTLEPAIDRQPVVRWDRKYLRPILIRSADSDGAANEDTVAGPLHSPRTLREWAIGPEGMLQRGEGSDADGGDSTDCSSDGEHSGTSPSHAQVRRPCAGYQAAGGIVGAALVQAVPSRRAQVEMASCEAQLAPLLDSGDAALAPEAAGVADIAATGADAVE